MDFSEKGIPWGIQNSTAAWRTPAGA